MKRRIVPSLVFLWCFLCAPLLAQDDIPSLFKSGVSDLNLIAKGYLSPGGTAFATGMGSNWYNTAETHSVLGFDLRIGTSLTITPASDRTFSLDGLTNLEPTSSVTKAPTIGGSGDEVEFKLVQPETMSDGSTPNPLAGREVTTFKMPAGLTKVLPTANVQLTVGLPLHNDLMVRFIPTVKTGNLEMSVWGVGVKNNFKKFIPGIKLLPFSASVLVAYNHFDFQYGFPTSAQVTPEDLLMGSGLDYVQKSGDYDYSTQRLEMSANALTANLIVSKDFLFITPYVGVGVTRTDFNLKMAGNYPTLGDPESVGGGVYKMGIVNVADPIHFKASQVMPGATVGLRLKILFLLSAHIQYTIQKYPTASAGFGVGFR